MENKIFLETLINNFELFKKEWKLTEDQETKIKEIVEGTQYKYEYEAKTMDNDKNTFYCSEGKKDSSYKIFSLKSSHEFGELMYFDKQTQHALNYKINLYKAFNERKEYCNNAVPETSRYYVNEKRDKKKEKTVFFSLDGGWNYIQKDDFILLIKKIISDN